MDENRYNTKVRQAMSDHYKRASERKSNYVKRLEEINSLLNSNSVYDLTYGRYEGLKGEKEWLERTIMLLDRELSIWDAARDICIEFADEMVDTPKAKINLQLELELCPYWDAKTHTRTHDCNSCHCASEGNSIDNAQCGVMVGLDRYCMLDCDIYGEVVKKLEEVKNV